MIPKEFSDYFSTRDPDHQQQIIDELLQMAMQNESLPLREEYIVIKCPHCRNNNIRGNGRLKTMQRYVCKECNKHFSLSTGKFWYALKKPGLVNKYVHCLVRGYSIRKSAEITGISVQTSFDWRHKLLSSFSSVFPLNFQGIVEMKDFCFEFSEKGKRPPNNPEKTVSSELKKPIEPGQQVAVIATCDRSGHEDLRVISLGSINFNDIIMVLRGRIQNAELLVSQSHKKYNSVKEKLNIDHKESGAHTRQKKADKIFHIQNINNMYDRLINFLHPFHGVATKYLQNYMNWFLMLEKIKDSTKKIATIAKVALFTDQAWFNFKNRNINIFFRT